MNASEHGDDGLGDERYEEGQDDEEQDDEEQDEDEYAQEEQDEDEYAQEEQDEEQDARQYDARNDSYSRRNTEISQIARERDCGNTLAEAIHYLKDRGFSRPVARFEFWINAIKNAQDCGTLRQLVDTANDDSDKTMSPETLFLAMCYRGETREILLAVAPSCDVVEFDNFPLPDIPDNVRKFQLLCQRQDELTLRKTLTACLSKQCSATA